CDVMAPTMAPSPAIINLSNSCWAIGGFRLLSVRAFVLYFGVKFLAILVLGLMTVGAAEQIVYPGWLKVPKPELVLHVQHEDIKPSARRDAGEFVLMIMRELIRSGFTIHVSREYLAQEIAYYEKFVNEERYPAMSKAVLSCLKQAQERGAFDWDALRKITPPEDDPIAIYDYFPWL